MFRSTRQVRAVAGIISFVCALCASQARAVSISVFASVGTAANEDNYEEPDKVFGEFDSEESIVRRFFLGGTNLFGLVNYTTAGNFDPWFATRIAITNLTDDPQSVGASLRFPMEPVLTPATPPFAIFTGLFTAELEDANGDGSASYTGGGAGFALFEPVLGASLTPSHSVQLMAPGLAVVYDIAGTPIPASPRIGQWNGMEFVHLAGGQLSPHDSIEFYVFGCVAPVGTSCPAAPELSLVPHPPALWLLVSALAALTALRRSIRA